MGTCQVHVEGYFYVHSFTPFVGQVKIVLDRYTFILNWPIWRVSSNVSVEP